MEGAHQHWVPYCGAAPLPAELLGRWNLDPLLLIALVVSAYAWARWAALRRLPRRRAFAAGAGLVLLLFVSPFCALSSALFSARVTHHVLLAVAVAPLLLLSVSRAKLPAPGGIALWTGLQTFVFWLWHAPPLYAAAMSSHAVYWAMQLTLLASAIGFWAALRRIGEPAAVAALLVSVVQMGLLGALITFAPTPLYAPHFASTLPWGLSPLADQQLAGLIMWVPSAGLYLGVALWIAKRWLDGESRAALP